VAAPVSNMSVAKTVAVLQMRRSWRVLCAKGEGDAARALVSHHCWPLHASSTGGHVAMELHLGWGRWEVC
jgi:hypothetical protein